MEGRSEGGNRRGAPEGVAGIVRRVLRAANLGPRIPEIDLKKHWREAVGEDLSRHAWPESLKHGELTLRVASGVWAQEILALQEDLLSRLRERLQTVAVQSIQVRIGRLPAAETAAPAKEALPPLSSLPAGVRQKLERIEDPEMREAIGRFILRRAERRG